MISPKCCPIGDIQKLAPIGTDADMVSEIEKQFKQNSKKFKMGTRVQYTKELVPTSDHSNEISDEWIEAFTDGSKTEKGSGIGAYFAENHPLNYSGPSVGPNSVFHGELSAIVYVLKNTPWETNIRIFTDSKSAIDLINKLIFHIKNNIRYKPNFVNLWIINEIITLIKLKLEKSHNRTETYL